MKLIKCVGFLLLVFGLTNGALAQLVDKKTLSLYTAKTVAAAAQAEAQKRNATVVIAVVDDGGYLILLQRLDDTQVASSEVAIAKARTAAIFRRPSKVFEDQIRNGRIATLALPGAAPLQGGLPLTYEGKVVGAIGVSGNSPQEDEDVAKIGVARFDALFAPQAGTYLDKEKVSSAFAKGAPLLETEGYKVHASRRDTPGLAEVHLWETDVIYVLEGGATFVPGGTIVDGKTTMPGEIRGPSINGGETHQLVKGDVFIVPNGVPHLFKEVSAPFLYFVVKPISGH